MSAEQLRHKHLDDGLSSLVNHLLPSTAASGRDKAEAFKQARRYSQEKEHSPRSQDLDQVAEHVRKTLKNGGRSEHSLRRFDELKNKLQAQSILSKKGEILEVLEKLSQQEHRTSSRRQERRQSLKPHGKPIASPQGSRRGESSHQSVAHRHRNSPSPPQDGTRSKNVRIPKITDVPSSSKQDNYDAGSSEAQVATPTEQELLHDLPFVLQGMDTKFMTFTNQNTLILPRGLSLPVISILHTLAEPSLLFRSLSSFIRTDTCGLVQQSLCSTISAELTTYLSLIATLEKEIRKQSQSCDRMAESDKCSGGATLTRCVLWLREAILALRLMSVIVEQSKTRRGGQIISLIYSYYTDYGDPFVTEFAQRLLGLVTKPCYEMLRRWIYEGELSDPYGEFFVVQRQVHDMRAREGGPKASGNNVWDTKFQLDLDMVPSIIGVDFARKIFLIGKSLNFLRYNCDDSDWVEAHAKARSTELRYGDTATLEASIDEAYKITMSRLTHLMNTKYQLSAHLDALKRYLLLGQGDFIALLMESLSSNLDRPAGSQYRHTLTAQLEHAIRGSNAQHDSPEVLRRLDARLTEMEKGDTGWDVFTLEYKVDAPADVIITPWANRQYLKIFNLLWRIKRVEFALASTWRRCMTGARGILASIDPKHSRDWKCVRCTIAEMIHFINQLQYYILFEVVEASWDVLQNSMAKADCTLDDIILAHTKYLRDITHKGLLNSSRGGANSGHREEPFTTQLHEILKDMLAYREAVDGLYSFSVTSVTRQQEALAKAETGDNPQRWLDRLDGEQESFANSKPSVAHESEKTTPSPFPIAPSLRHLPSDETSILPALRARLDSLASGYRSRINTMLGDLASQPDVNMRFLGVVMNFNDVYQPRRRKRHAPTAEAKPAPQSKEET